MVPKTKTRKVATSTKNKNNVDSDNSSMIANQVPNNSNVDQTQNLPQPEPQPEPQLPESVRSVLPENFTRKLPNAPWGVEMTVLIEAWNGSSSTDEFLVKVGLNHLKKDTVQPRISQFRRVGMNFKKMPIGRPLISIESCYDFIEVWQTSKTVDEVATRLNSTKPKVRSRASFLRNALGVKLKYMYPSLPQTEE